jgi:hypothetical protein
MRKRLLPGLNLYCLATPCTKKDGVRVRNVASISARRAVARTGIDGRTARTELGSNTYLNPNPTVPKEKAIPLKK